MFSNQPGGLIDPRLSGQSANTMPACFVVVAAPHHTSRIANATTTRENLQYALVGNCTGEDIKGKVSQCTATGRPIKFTASGLVNTVSSCPARNRSKYTQKIDGKSAKNNRRDRAPRPHLREHQGQSARSSDKPDSCRENMPHFFGKRGV